MHCQITGNEAADSLAKKGARILQTHSNDLSYHSVKLYIRQFFNKLQKEDIEQKIKDKHWKKEIFQVGLTGQKNISCCF